MKISIRNIGNAKEIVLRKPAKPVRTGWAQAAEQLAAQGEDALLMGEFPNEGDAELNW